MLNLQAMTDNSHLSDALALTVFVAVPGGAFGLEAAARDNMCNGLSRSSRESVVLVEKHPIPSGLPRRGK